MTELKKNDIFTGHISGYSSEGQGIARIDGRAVFVRGAIDGEDARIHVLKASGNAIFAKAEAIISPSEHRREPECPYYRLCGGCEVLHMDYEEELNFKRHKVDNALERIGGLSLKTDGIIGSDSRWRYRNKAVYAVSNGENGAVTGFYQPRSHNVIAVSDCLIQSEYSARAAAAVRAWMDECGIYAWEDGSGKGSVRHLFARYGYKSGEGQTALVAVRDPGHKDELVKKILKACPETKSIVLLINPDAGNTVLKGREIVLWGEGSIMDELCGNKYSLSPLSFYQVNRDQAERLYNCAMEFAGENIGLALDLYCGAGTITLCLAKRAERVIGAEIVESAISDAWENAKRNKVENVSFFCADAGETASRLLKEGLRPEVIVVDPPRKGLSAETIDAAAGMLPDRIVYVSCDPATLARDLKIFAGKGYSAIRARAFDLFPGTVHVETCVLLVRENVKDEDCVSLSLDLHGLKIPQGEYTPPEKPTYGNVKKWIKEIYGVNVSNLYIAQVKDKLGLEKRANYNLGEGKNKVPVCPEEKEAMIREAFKHFKLI